MEHAEKLDRRPNEEERTENAPLEEALDRIARDAQQDPEGYARDTIVPKGGE